MGRGDNEQLTTDSPEPERATHAHVIQRAGVYTFRWLRYISELRHPLASTDFLNMLANLRSALAGAKPTAATPVAALPPPAPAAAAVTSHASSNGEAAAASRAQTLTVAGFEIEGISIAGQVTGGGVLRGVAPHACERP